MPLYSEHITNMYYSGAPSYTGSSYGYNSSVSPLGLSYSASYLTPGGSYSSHSSLGGYSRAPISSRWVSSVGRNYSPILSTISERTSGSPIRINSPRRIPISKRSYTGSNYTPRPVNINTADIDVSRDKYRRKIESPKSSYKEKPRENPCTEKENSPFMPRVDGKPETGIDSSPGLQRSTIKRGRTVVRLHTLKRKERDSPRKPVDISPTNDQKDINNEAKNNKDDKNKDLNESTELRKDPIKKEDEIDIKTTDENIMEKIIVGSNVDNISSEKKVESISNKKNSTLSLPVCPMPTSGSTTSKSPERRFSMELLAEQASLLDSLIRNENLSTASLDLSKVGVLDKSENSQSLDTSASKELKFQANPLKTTKSDQSLHESLKYLKKYKDPKHNTKRRSLKKSSSGGSICRLDSITEFPKDLNHTELPNIEERLPVKTDNISALSKPKPKLKNKITSSVEISTPKSPLKFKVENVIVEEKLRVPKKEIIYSSEVDEIPSIIVENKKSNEKSTLERSNDRCSIKRKTKKVSKDDNDPASPEPEDGNFWNKIAKRETVYLIKRKQELNDAKEKTRRALCWFPEDKELDKNVKIEAHEVSELSPISSECKGPSELLENLKIDDMSIDSKDNFGVETSKDTIRKETEVNISNGQSSTVILNEEDTFTEPQISELSVTKTEDSVDSKTRTLNDPIIEPKSLEIVTKIEAVPSVFEESKIDELDSNVIASKPTNCVKIDSKETLDIHEIVTCKNNDILQHSQETESESNVMELKEKISIKNKESEEKCDPKKTCKENKDCIEKLPKSILNTEQSISKNKISEDGKTENNVCEETKKEIDVITDKKKTFSSNNVVAEQKVLLKPVKKTSQKDQLKDKFVNKIHEQPKHNKTETNSTKQSKPNEVTPKITQKIKITSDLRDTPSTSKTNLASDVIDVKPPEKEANDSNLAIQEEACTNNIELSNKISINIKSTDPSIKPIVIESENIPTLPTDNKHEVVINVEKTGEEQKAENISKHEDKQDKIEPSPKKVIILPPVTKAKKILTQLPPKVLVATPRPLQKRAPQVIRSSTSESSSEEESSDEDDETAESSTSEESTEFFECENNQDGRISTGSNDSGFDSSAPTSPAAFLQIKKDCDVNCHRKCEKLTANLCGVNQRLLVEALASRTASKRGADTPGTSSGAPAQNVPDILEQELEQSTAYGIYRKTGRFTPPATSIPRFRKYNVEDFHFVKVLGKGSFGKVLLAELRDTEYYYAVKCLKKDVVLEDDDVECTLIERKVLALGTNHPYLCHLFATFQTDSHLFFVMEYLNGGDLMFHIQQSGRFPEARARFYAAEIVSGLKFLHKRGIVYRDLKLDNILLDFDGHVRIADFGMCKLQIYLDKTADTFCGTPDYMAPEIIKGLKYNQTVDWWSFGVLLYEMLIGQSPFSGCDEDELFWSICNEMPSYPRFLSQEALTILTRFLDKDARTRLGGSECMHGDIRDQDFFHQIHWERLERRDLEAPFRPRVRHPLDTQYFDRAFTGERPRLTAVEPHVLRSMDQEPFRGFSYTNPNATDR